MQRLAVYIDIEGFSAIYRASEDRGFEALRRLMLGVYEVWSRFIGEDADRLFAHQFSDGFLILQDDWRSTIDRGVAVAVGLMRYLLAWGFVGRAGIATGDFSDISSLYRAVQREAKQQRPRPDPPGVMTTARVMGDALINAYNVQTNGYSGPLLFVQPGLRNRITGQHLVLQADAQRLLVVDWIRSDVPFLDEVLRVLDRGAFTASLLSELLDRYVGAHSSLSAAWRENAGALVAGRPARLRSKHRDSRLFWFVLAGCGLGFAAGRASTERRRFVR